MFIQYYCLWLECWVWGGYGFLCFSLFFVFHDCFFPLAFITSSAYPLVHVPRLYCSRVQSLSVSPFMSLFLSGLSVQSPWFHPSLHLDVWCSHVLITPCFILIVPRLLCTVLSLLPLSCFTPISFSCVPICPIIWLVCMYCLSVPLSFVTSSVMPCALSPCFMFNEVESFRLYLNLHSISIPCPLSQISQSVVYREWSVLWGLRKSSTLYNRPEEMQKVVKAHSRPQIWWKVVFPHLNYSL